MGSEVNCMMFVPEKWVNLLNTGPSLGFPHASSSSLMAAFATADACDRNPELISNGDLRALYPIFKIYGQRRCFSGQIVTLKVFEDNKLVREQLETKGEGRVLIIDGGGSMRYPVFGGNLGESAQKNGWVGIIVNGCIRDVDEIKGCDIGVRALGSIPLKPGNKGHGEKNVPVNVGGTLIRDGEWLYADNDGVLISKFELSNLTSLPN